MAQYVQGGIFGGLNSAPLGWPVTFGETPPVNAIPSLPGNTLSGNAPNVTTNLQGATLGQGIQGSTISTPGATATPNTAQASTNQATPAPSGLTSGSLADYFARAIIIILGFIFIAVGLNMLRPGTVPLPGRR